MTKQQDLYIPEITFSVSFDKKVKKSQLFKVVSNEDAATVVRSVFNKDTMDWIEEVFIIFVNRRNAMLGFCKISTGGTAGAIVDPKVIFSLALKVPGTSGIIVAHNHPSGNTQPSREDKDLARKLVEGGKILEIAVIDFMIITDESYYSFRGEGLL
jgi:DNA repair protein RadC